MDVREVIARLTVAKGPSRGLDSYIAKALGFRRVPKSKERGAYWLSSDGKEVKIPWYTFSFDAAYRLALTAGPKGGVSWDRKTGAAQIGRGSSHVASTAPIALCIATLYTLSENKEDDPKHVE